MIKGIIFDLDGTLLDTIEDLGTSVNETLAEYGFSPLSMEEIKHNVGNGMRKIVERSLPEGHKDLIDEALPKFLDHYSHNYLKKTAAYPGALAFLEEMQKRKIKLAVLTNKKENYSIELMKDRFPSIRFLAVYGDKEGRKKKPDPTACLELLEKMGLKKAEVLYLGDGEADITTAHNAGLACLWVSWGFRSYEDIKELKPEYRADSFAEVKNYL